MIDIKVGGSHYQFTAYWHNLIAQYHYKTIK